MDSAIRGILAGYFNRELRDPPVPGRSGLIEGIERVLLDESDPCWTPHFPDESEAVKSMEAQLLYSAHSAAPC